MEAVSASVRSLLARVGEQDRRLDDLSDGPFGSDDAFGAFGRPLGGPSPEPRPILELAGPERDDELDALSDWVDDFLLPTYGAEVTTAAPWCPRWQEHDDVVAWLHALWLAYQQHSAPDAGPSGMLIWHRDFLTHTMAAIRAPGGPLSACTTTPDRPAHRLLPHPGTSVRSDRPDAG
ncbi:DUF4913 domain-containing protein [Streptomyces sp. MS19]|uniref:DUF4913 domain-containing protein n=1 Tax=Streptomyces sp. MS19 TaxID=3385972 RepID=UPI0039A1E7DC